MDKPIKLKKCSVKLNRLAFMGVTPAEIQEQILDQRIRKCSVRLHRFSEADVAKVKPITSFNGNKIRRFCIRVPRLNISRSEISSPANSMVSLNYASDSEMEDYKQNESQGF